MSFQIYSSKMLPRRYLLFWQIFSNTLSRPGNCPMNGSRLMKPLFSKREIGILLLTTGRSPRHVFVLNYSNTLFARTLGPTFFNACATRFPCRALLRKPATTDHWRSDVVPHQRLLHKLDHYGIRGPTLLWIQNFLITRTQKVVVDGSFSDTAHVGSGVPQGTVLGPILFLSYINDLQSSVSSDVGLFADDCLLYRAIKSKDDQKKLQEDLTKLERWADIQMFCPPSEETPG